MNRWAQFRQTLKQPAYRAKLAFFLLLGFTVVLLAVLLQNRSPFWSGVLREFAVTFGAIGMLQLLWDFLGGEPMELRVEEIKDEVRNIKSSMILLSDLIDGNVGIERIWPDRRAWQLDSVHGLKTWQTWVAQASEVEIMSHTLWNNWLHQDRFRKQLFANLTRGASVRVLVYDPDSDLLRLRTIDERDAPGEMQQEIKSTLLRLGEGWNDLDESAKKNLEVRLTNQSPQYAQIIRADEQMLVAIYLSGKSGGLSPTMQLRGAQSAYFVKYANQFEIMWKRAESVDDARFRQMLKEYNGLHPPRPEY